MPMIITTYGKAITIRYQTHYGIISKRTYMTSTERIKRAFSAFLLVEGTYKVEVIFSSFQMQFMWIMFYRLPLELRVRTGMRLGKESGEAFIDERAFHVESNYVSAESTLRFRILSFSFLIFHLQHSEHTITTTGMIFNSYTNSKKSLTTLTLYGGEEGERREQKYSGTRLCIFISTIIYSAFFYCANDENVLLAMFMS